MAREYTAEDLSVIAICCALEEQCGLRRDVISNLVSEIRRVLAVPRAVTTGARLVVTPNPPSARYIDDDTPANAGTVLPLSPLLQRIDHYLLGNLGVWSDPQRPLDLGPVSIACTGSSFTVHGKQPVRKTGKQHGAG